MCRVSKLTAMPVLLSLYFWRILTLPTCLSHHSTQAEAPKRVQTFKKHYSTAALQRLTGVLQAWNLKTIWDTYWIMHKQTVFLGQAPKICITQKSPSWGKEEARSGGKEEMEVEGRNGAEGENPNQIKTKLDVRGCAEAPEWLQLAVAFMWLMWLRTEDQRARGQICGSLRKCADKSRRRRKMSGSEECTAGASPSFRWPRIIRFLLLSEYFKPFLSNSVELLQHKSSQFPLLIWFGVGIASWVTDLRNSCLYMFT